MHKSSERVDGSEASVRALHLAASSHLLPGGAVDVLVPHDMRGVKVAVSGDHHRRRQPCRRLEAVDVLSEATAKLLFLVESREEAMCRSGLVSAGPKLLAQAVEGRRGLLEECDVKNGLRRGHAPPQNALGGWMDGVGGEVGCGGGTLTSG